MDMEDPGKGQLAFGMWVIGFGILALLVRQPWSGIGFFLILAGLMQVACGLIVIHVNPWLEPFLREMVRDIRSQLREAVHQRLNRQK